MSDYALFIISMLIGFAVGLAFSYVTGLYRRKR
jgi:hypothetical protein